MKILSKFKNFDENTEKKFTEGAVIPTSKQDLEENDYSSNSENVIPFSEDDNNINFSTNNENFLYGNDFSLIKKPFQLGSTRNCLFIDDYPIISIGKNILLPLLLILFICLSYLFIWYNFLNYSGELLKKMFNYFFIAYLISHILAIFLNPGIPSLKYHRNIINDLRNNKIKELDTTKCNICNLVYQLKDKISHCNKCNVCYYEYEHHCDWIGHCIGKYNRYFFGIFVFSLLIYILICFTMIFIKILKIFIN